MIVADTNLLLYAFTQSSNSELSDLVLSQVDKMAVPLLAIHEVVHVLKKMCRGNLISFAQASECLNSIRKLPLVIEHEPNFEAILKFSPRSDVDGYDAAFVCLAIEFDCPLLTYDKRLLNAAPDVAMHPLDFFNLYSEV